MGVSESIEIRPQFEEIVQWPFSRVETSLEAYASGEYDFGVDFKVVMNLTGYEELKAKQLIQVHSRNDLGVVNALTLLITFICLGDPARRNYSDRLEKIFNLFDFNRESQISLDDLTVLVLCISSSFGFVLSKTDEAPNDAACIKIAANIYETLNKRTSSRLTRKELEKWTYEHLWSNGHETTVDAVFEQLKHIETHVAASEGPANAGH